MSLSKSQISEYRQLKQSGVDVTKHNKIAPNGGSETARHLSLKALAAHAGLMNGYRVDSEVTVENDHVGSGEIDILLWGHKTRLSWAVEVETSICAKTTERKQAKYVDETAVDDIVILNVAQAPENIVDAYGWTATELGLDP